MRPSAGKYGISITIGRHPGNETFTKRPGSSISVRRHSGLLSKLLTSVSTAGLRPGSLLAVTATGMFHGRPVSAGGLENLRRRARP